MNKVEHISLGKYLTDNFRLKKQFFWLVVGFGTTGMQECFKFGLPASSAKRAAFSGS